MKYNDEKGGFSKDIFTQNRAVPKRSLGRICDLKIDRATWDFYQVADCARTFFWDLFILADHCPPSLKLTNHKLFIFSMFGGSI